MRAKIVSALAIFAAVATVMLPHDATAQARFDGWASIIIAADWRDSDGRPIEAFDNARRDLSAGFQQAGFPPDLHASLTLNPAKSDAHRPADALRRIAATTQRATSGCLFYLTSHGSPQMLVFGESKGLEPVDLAQMLRQWCGNKPTVVVLSACYAGSFVDALRGPHRMVLTAARRDRSSFGCAEDELYPWFDACMLESLPSSTDFLDLARQARACVGRREIEAKVSHPSEPQLFVGPDMQMRLPTLRFTGTR